MKIFLVPRAAPRGSVRIWVGVLASQPPVLAWRVDGIPIASTRIVPLRPLASAIPAALLGDRLADNFTGVFEINGLDSGQVYNFTVDASTNEVPPVFRLLRGGVYATSFSFC
ncbi:MAG: hypothetical protein H0X43_11855 [Nitrosospira sp.]|nr:hypothetical protein [Nitrosospira sp.]